MRAPWAQNCPFPPRQGSPSVPRPCRPLGCTTLFCCVSRWQRRERARGSVAGTHLRTGSLPCKRIRDSVGGDVPRGDPGMVVPIAVPDWTPHGDPGRHPGLLGGSPGTAAAVTRLLSPSGAASGQRDPSRCVASDRDGLGEVCFRAVACLAETKGSGCEVPRSPGPGRGCTGRLADPQRWRGTWSAGMSAPPFVFVSLNCASLGGVLF